MMTQAVGGEIGEQSPLLGRSLASAPALRRIFESEETGLFHLTIADGERVAIGHDQLVSLVLCLHGEALLSEGERALVLESGSYAVIPEGHVCELGTSDAAAQVLLFFGFEQLPGAFFNSYGPANVQDG